MKKLLCGILVIVMMLSLVACGKKLSGTYEAKIADTGVAYTFKGSKVVVETFVLGAEVSEVEGTYKIDGDEITLTFESESSKDDVLEGTFQFTEGKDSIKIGILELKKAK